jgi:hypothetical protein
MSTTFHTACNPTARARPGGIAAAYLRFCADHLDELAACVARGRADGVQCIAGVLAQNAERLGLDRLARLARRLETDSRLGRPARLHTGYRAIARYVHTLCRGRPTAVAVSFEPPTGVRRFQVGKGAPAG